MFKNMKIRIRLLLGFSAVLVLLIAIIITSLTEIKASQNKLKRIVEVNDARLLLASKMGNIARDNSISMRNIMLAPNDKGSIKEMEDSIKTRRKIYDENSKTLHELTPIDDIKAHNLLDKTDISRDSTRSDNNKIIELLLSGRYNDALYVLNSGAAAQRLQWINDLDAVVNNNIRRNIIRYKEAEKAAVNARSFMLLIGVIAISLAIIISIFLTQSITRPLKISVQAADMIASGDLTVDPASAGKRGDEVGLLLQSFSKMVENLRRSVKDINEGVNMLGSSASEILAATTQVASGTAETASAISETTSTVEEVQQAAKLSAQKAKNVADSAQKLAQVSQNGQIAVDETVKGMNRISEQMDSIAQIVVQLSEQSQSIGGIIASVTDIADQSNLLAVNAAIEAAKAGEQGKGFAVVAREIKNLAEQSKQSTSQVRNILNDVQKVTSAAVMATEQGSNAVEAGVKQSALTGDAIRILTESSNEAVQAAIQIVASSQQQVIGMDQIGLAMQNINQAGTETAVSMLESEKAAKNLHELGQKLKDLVDRFKV